MKYAINLFPHSDLGIVDKVAYFSLHYLRYIIVITLLCVELVFFYRLQIDQTIIDEKEKLSNKASIIKSTESLRSEIDSAEQKIVEIKKIVGQQEAFFAQLDYMQKNVPKNVTVDTLNIDDKSVNLNGRSVDPELVKLFYRKLQKDKFFKTVELRQLRKSEGVYLFEVVASTSSPSQP